MLHGLVDDVDYSEGWRERETERERWDGEGRGGGGDKPKCLWPLGDEEICKLTIGSTGSGSQCPKRVFTLRDRRPG